MTFLDSLTIPAKLIAASVTTVAVAMTLLTLGNLWTARKGTLADLQAHATALGAAQAGAIGDWAAAKSLVVASLVPIAGEPSPQPLLLLASNAGGFDGTYLGFEDRTHAFSTPPSLPPDFDITSRPWYRLAAQAGRTALTAPYVDAGTRKLVVTFATPVKDGSRLIGVAAGDIFIDSVVARVNAIKPSANSFAFLVDASGQVIAHPDPALTLKPATTIAPALDARRLAAMRESPLLAPFDIGGVAHRLSMTAVPHTDWSLVLALSERDAFATLVSMSGTSALIGIGMLGVAALLLGWTTTRLLRRLRHVRSALRDIASGNGDLTRRLLTDGNDELAQVGRSFNEFADKIAAMMRGIRQTTDSVNTAATEIATGNLDLSNRTEQTASRLELTASSMDELTSTVQQTAESARTANGLASNAVDAARRGGAIVSDVVSTMTGITASSQKIGDIVGVIDGIAFQTNILALNAAVEAARAGEQGRGFAVVASEVRSLAQRSAGAAKEIKVLIGDSVDKVRAGARLVQDAGTSMNDIVASVSRVSDIIGEITTAASEQSDGIGQVGAAVNELDRMTQQNAALVEQSAAAAQSLRDQAHQLAQLVSGFRIEATPSA